MASSTDYSRKYARAFLGALNDFDDAGLQKVGRELTELSLLAKNPVKDFFENPIFHQDEKRKVLEEIFEKHTVTQETRQFLLTLLELDQLQNLDSITQQYLAALDEKNQEAKVQVSTAYALGKKESEQIRSAFENILGKKVLLEVTIDKDLIGGVRAFVGGVVYDSSIQGHLMRLQKEFTM